MKLIAIAFAAIVLVAACGSWNPAWNPQSKEYPCGPRGEVCGGTYGNASCCWAGDICGSGSAFATSCPAGYCCPDGPLGSALAARPAYWQWSAKP